MTFLKLTAPNADRTPVYIKADDISLIRTPIDGAQEAKTVLYVFGIPQYVRETPEQILTMLNATNAVEANKIKQALFNQTHE